MSLKKLESMRYIENLGLPVARYSLTQCKNDVIEWGKETGWNFTIRTIKSSGTDCDLPFYEINDEFDLNEEIISSLDIYSFILTDGKRFDKVLDMNACLSFNSNCDYSVDYSRDNCTLRAMYKRGINTVKGNFMDGSFKIVKEYSDIDVLRDKEIFESICLEVANKVPSGYSYTIEFSSYKEDIHSKYERLNNKIFWQLRKDKNGPI